MKKLEGKIAIITGAAKGNGKGIAKVFVKHGATVILTDVDQTVIKTAKEVGGIGFVMDVTNKKQISEVVKQIIETHNTIDILVNNAGIVQLIPFLEMSDEVRDKMFDVDIKGVWNCTKEILPIMVEKKYGRIVNISSVTGVLVADKGETAYGAAKGAVWGFTRTLAYEVAKHGITVNAVLPGMIDTPMVRNACKESFPDNPELLMQMMSNGIALGRLGKPEEIGEVVAFLASNEASYITGSPIIVDGGSTIPESAGLVGLEE
ncbi:SDR family oxidoreductase [archaeon]|jgi:NAD(P)-dependent dehydrogenase (short-subunit alcohol dehydrogenase family)|nr:SDR family oxidoreductase [archaeon]MBT4022837.1 SDR family oxidoreductase [archaeon]MBT4272969.1 SDR family oxidoreductase [archaeon]MBT4460940.1 SDR family oxidoreductase [archaeon]MBT4858032.1 SDR family oxidoreductase [archaeon]